MTQNKAIAIKIVAALLGGLGGYLYWYFIGCEDGCTIQSVWWRMSLWAAIMAYLISAILLDFFKPKHKQ